MKPFFFEVVLPSTLMLGAVLGCIDVRAFVLALATGLLLGIVGALLGHLPLVPALVMAFCLVVAAQVGYAAALIARAHRLSRKRQSQAVGDAEAKTGKQSADPSSSFCTKN